MDWRPIWERIKVGDKKNLLEVENGRFFHYKGRLVLMSTVKRTHLTNSQTILKNKQTWHISIH
jgi:hypothetical protein